jgi:D-alanyl-lipoteichoic acid acyltransferase DltB (MBOAT superfamily)
MHLIIDAHNRDIDRNVGFLSYLHYTLNFTTLVSGPIQRYPEFIDQHLAPRDRRLPSLISETLWNESSSDFSRSAS